jgi:RND superfamily putative drug exporter
MAATGLAVAASGLLQLHASGVPQTKLLLAKSEAVDGQAVLGAHFDGGSGSPAYIVAPLDRAEDVLRQVRATAGVGNASLYNGAANPAVKAADVQPKILDGNELIIATLTQAADADAAQDTVHRLRTDLAATGVIVKIGGVTATAIDTNATAERDLTKIIPIVLLVILVILILLLRSVVAPIILVGTVVLSYAATLGLAALVFNHLFHFAGADPTVPLFGFVFLVALGIDYNIFLMTRVREETMKRGTRPGILQGLGKTGGVITSAGVVLAATFAALGVIPILFLAQIAFIVAFGVLLDTVIVRSLLVPALAYDLGKVIWWPARLSREEP